MVYYFTAFLLVVLSGCSSSEEREGSRLQSPKGEAVNRMHHEYLSVDPPVKVEPPSYPWEKMNSGHFPPITKEFFRCKGSHLNPVHLVQKKNEIERYFDCGGADKHSLPLREQKEFIYPILIELLNHIQSRTNKRVVITSGHRCPEHNNYVDPSIENQASKHMIGAEVSFYVQGMEDNPQRIIQEIMEFYKNSPRTQGQKEYEVFLRYEKEDTNVSTPPWYNKEVFIKLFKKKEGRNFDNRHPYPYIDIQVRHDRDLDERVVYTWEKANRNFYRK